MDTSFSDGWIEFEEFIGRLKATYSLTEKDIDEYFKMYKGKEKDE